MPPVRLLAVLAAAALAVGSAAPPAAAAPRGRDGVEVVQAAYGQDPAQRLTVFEPPGDGPRPAVLFVHGGCWLQRHPKLVELAVARRIAEETGWVVGALSYRTASPRWQVEPADVSAGLALLRTGGFRVDPSRVALWGESSGAHLALLAALAGPSPGRPRAVVSVSGPTDMRAMLASGGFVPLCVMAFEGGAPGHGAPADRYAETSPVDRVLPGAPPVFLAASAGDSEVPPGQAAELAAALQRAGVPHEVHYLPGDDHAYGAEDDRPAAADGPVRRLAEEFLAGYLR